MLPLASIQLHMLAQSHCAKPVHFGCHCRLSTFGNTQQQCAPDQDGALLVPGCNCFLVHAPCAGHTPAARISRLDELAKLACDMQCFRYMLEALPATSNSPDIYLMGRRQLQIRQGTTAGHIAAQH